MRRGTTPTHIFTLPFDTAMLQAARVAYAQRGKLVLVKKTEDGLILEGNTVTVKLSQEDTLKFCNSQPVEVQVRVLTLGGEALASDPETVPVLRCLDNEVIA